MKPFPFIIVLLFFLPFARLSGQQLSNRRSRSVVIYPVNYAPIKKERVSVRVESDTLEIDTLSIIPGTFSASYHGHPLDTSLYIIDAEEGLIILNSKWHKSFTRPDTLQCWYRAFPYLFSKTLQHKDNSVIHPTLFQQQQAYIYNVQPDKTSNDIFGLGTLSKSGSISRGITFGNAQNLTVNSNLNLQLAGKLSNNVNVEVAATDNNLPIQPEGNVQQLQDFDKVYIKLYNKDAALTAGDFELQNPDDYFMKYYKKAEGGLFSTRFIMEPSKDTNHEGIMKITVAGAISKGKYARNNITPIDGNLGPYRLSGNDNENFIVVLSGSEKVYINGELMLRGQNNDYTIDYNSALLTFTPKHLITVSTIITVEFQYSDQSYVRSLFEESTEYHKDNLNLRLNIYSEQDAKNQPLLQTLNDTDKAILASVGNKIQNAVVPGVDSIPWNNNQVLYRKKYDSVVNTITYPTVYVYTTDSVDYHYFSISFSQVAQGQGDYIEIQSAANGRVFKWVAPVNNVHQGNYEPVILLISPKQQQMVTVGGDYKLSAHTGIFSEFAFSNNNENTFSSIDKGTDAGFAGKIQLHNVYFFSDSTKENKGNVWRIQTILGYEGLQKDFAPIERYRPVEFDRDWNRTNDSIYDNQHIIDTHFILTDKKNSIGVESQEFLEGGNYNATKQNLILKTTEEGFLTTFTGSLLNTKTSSVISQYWNETAGISHKLFIWTIGAGEDAERDIFRSRTTDSIISTASTLFEQANTFQYYQWNCFIKSADSSKNNYGINYNERTDLAPDKTESIMQKTLFSRNISLDLNLVKNPKSRFKGNIVYHILNVLDTSLAAGQTPVNAIVGQAEYDLIALKGLISANTFYQAGSGLQPKESYTYLQVAQGTGVYAWTDFNHDGIKELNEFYIAPFQDEADYVRVYTPTNQFLKTYTSGFTETFNLRPSAIWNSKKDFRSFINRFTEQFSFHVDRKTMSSDIWSAYNPFLQKTNDTNVVGLNSSLRNTLFFNRLNTTWGADYTYSSTINKTVLEEEGPQSRINNYNDLHVRWNFIIKWILEGEGKIGEDVSNAGYFITNNYYINYYQLQPKLTYQPGSKFRTSLLFIYSDKVNQPALGGGTSVQENIGVELKYNVVSKGSLTGTFNFIKISFNGESYSPVGTEMLQGLATGNNLTWSLAYQFNLSGNVQVSLLYNGRSTPASPIVNTGSAQVRAFF